MGLSQRDQTKHNTLLRLGTQSVKSEKKKLFHFFSLICPSWNFNFIFLVNEL